VAAGRGKVDIRRRRQAGFETADGGGCLVYGPSNGQVSIDIVLLAISYSKYFGPDIFNNWPNN
jgi:hypothetical protein